jgi:hypothetical protein
MPLKPISFNSIAECHKFFLERKQFLTSAKNLIISTNGYTYFLQDIKEAFYEKCNEDIKFFVLDKHKIKKTISLQMAKEILNQNDQELTFTLNYALYKLLEKWDHERTEFPICTITQETPKNPAVTIYGQTYELEFIKRCENDPNVMGPLTQDDYIPDKFLRDACFYIELKKIEDFTKILDKDARSQRLRKLREEFVPTKIANNDERSSILTQLANKKQELESASNGIVKTFIVALALGFSIMMTIITLVVLLLIFLPTIPIFISVILGMAAIPLGLLTFYCYANLDRNSKIFQEEIATLEKKLNDIDIVETGLGPDKLNKRHQAISSVENPEPTQQPDGDSSQIRKANPDQLSPNYNALNFLSKNNCKPLKNKIDKNQKESLHFRK